MTIVRIVLADPRTGIAVTVTDLGSAVTAMQVDIAVPGGTQQVTTRLADGLALAVITGAPLAVDDPVMDRLAEPVTDPEPLSAFRGRQQAPSGPPEHAPARSSTRPLRG